MRHEASAGISTLSIIALTCLTGVSDEKGRMSFSSQAIQMAVMAAGKTKSHGLSKNCKEEDTREVGELCAAAVCVCMCVCVPYTAVVELQADHQQRSVLMCFGGLLLSHHSARAHDGRGNPVKPPTDKVRGEGLCVHLTVAAMHKLL